MDTLLSSLIELLPLIFGVHVGHINLISKKTGSISAAMMSIILILFFEGLFLGACAFCYFTDRIPGHPFHKPAEEQVEAAPEAPEAEAVEAEAEAPAETVEAPAAPAA